MTRFHVLSCLGLLLVTACDSDDSDQEASTGGSGMGAGDGSGGMGGGAASGTGGQLSTGGASSGTGGEAAGSGGIPGGTGGEPATGGVSPGTGGDTSSGGTTSTGGSAPGTGGALNNARVESLCMESEAVAYSGPGNTCNFSGSPNLVNLPKLAIDELNYNEFFTGAGYNQPFDPASGGLFSGGDWWNGFNGEAKGCGACLRVTGSNGSIVGMVWEIADINAVGSNGAPTNVHIESTYVSQVRPGGGVGVDVVIQPVPCPITESIGLKALIYNANQTWYNAVFYTPYNYVYPIEKLEIRAEVHDQWYELHSDWTNRFRYENYSPERFPHDTTNSPVRFRVTSIYGDIVESDPIQMVELPIAGESTHTAYYDLGVNFSARQVPAGMCTLNSTCGNKKRDANEVCEIAFDAPVTCASLGEGSGTAECDPTSCTWNISECQ